ncbi:MAG: hypothetical protein FWG87_01130 [Defluviitaleaceae bacterium]|nr:hypothetical protein [Defluviitaleaceae bacterium]
MSLSEYNHLTEIQGCTLLNIVSNKNVRLDADFKIDLKTSSFDVSIENLDDTSRLCFARYFWLGDARKSEYIYCIDNNNIPFTLFDCRVHLSLSLNKISIWWSNIIIGVHILDKDTCMVDKLSCVIDNSVWTYRAGAGVREYKIMSDTITVKTSLRDIFEITSAAPLSFSEMKKHFNSLLEMYSLWIGHIPQIKEMRVFCGEDTEFIYATHHDILFSSHSKRGYPKYLELSNSNDFSSAYDKWYAMQNKNPYVFNMFRLALDGRDMFEELRVNILIQCLEGYIGTHYKKKVKSKGKVTLERKIFSAINLNCYTQKIFARENDVKLSKNQTYLKKFVQKAVRHRNFISHLFMTEDYFNHEENGLAFKKIEFLLRLCFLHDIGLAIIEDTLNSRIREIEKRFPIDILNPKHKGESPCQM